MKRITLLLLSLWLTTSLKADAISEPWVTSKISFAIDESTIEVKMDFVNLKYIPVSCYEFYFKNTKYRYVPPRKKRKGFLEVAASGRKLVNFDETSNCGLKPESNDTLILIHNDNVTISRVPYSYSGNLIHEVSSPTERQEVAKTDDNFDKFLLASLIALKSSDLYDYMEINYTNGNDLTEYIKDQRTRDSAAYSDSRDFFQNNFDPYYQSLSAEEQAILIGKGSNKIDIESIRSDLDLILYIYDYIGNPNYYVSRFSLIDLQDFQIFVSTRKRIERGIAAYNRHFEEIKAKREENEAQSIREQWRQENTFSHEVKFDYVVKKWECAICHSNCVSYGSLSHSLLSESELSDSEYYLELYRMLVYQAKLSLNLLFRGCSHEICSESVTGKTRHQWKEINSENKSEILEFKNL